MGAQFVALPGAVGGWKLAGPPQRIHSGNIFDYMNGAGELYLAYHFRELHAYEYRDGSGNDILVELYRMKGSDDAFGLLSLDWGGEAIVWKPGTKDAPVPEAVPPARALYGTGLLRLWSNDLYARIMAVRETPEAREAILKLGGTIVAGRPEPPRPALLRLLPAAPEPHWKLKKERSAFFRSHLVLNSLYYLSHENLLGLDASCEAVFSTYDGEGKRFHLLVVQYADENSAARGLDGFLQAYIPEGEKGAVKDAGSKKVFFQVEDGWLGCKLSGRRLALVFQCPDLGSVRGIVEQVGLDKS